MSSLKQDELKVLESKTSRSREVFLQSKLVAPFGIHSNYRFAEPYPHYFTRGRGPKIWDVDGNEYVDYNMAFGALVVGHGHPLIVEALREQLENSTILGYEFQDTHRYAKLLCERFGIDMVKLSTTGTEATMYAIRFARAFTGREKILKFEGCFHGGSDAVLVSVKPTRAKAGHRKNPIQVPASLGIPKAVTQNTIVAPFNDVEALESIMRKHGGEVGAMILEPVPMNMGYVQPRAGFLEAVRRLADEYSSVLIFDEIKTCGKFYGGAQDQFKVNADLITLGKAIGGGLPISGIGGKKEIMETVVPGLVSHAGTFNSNPLSVTAGIVTLTKILTRNAMHGITSLSEKLAKGYRDIIGDQKLRAKVSWGGTSGAVAFTDHDVVDWRTFQDCDIGKWYAYCFAMMNRGVIPAGPSPDEQWTVSAQHGQEDIEKHIEAFKQVTSYIRQYETKLPIVEAV
jgi:glutamate-1-semialdehyde 2,1-aminomutase